jgi:hypothetical protein
LIRFAILILTETSGNAHFSHDVLSLITLNWLKILLFINYENLECKRLDPSSLEVLNKFD